MRTVAVVLYDQAPAFELAIPGEVFGAQTLRNHYRVRHVAGEPGPLRTSSGWRVEPQGGLRTLAAADVVVVAGWRDEPAEQPPPSPLLAALRRAHRNGAEVVSLCTGAFVLAAAGLLDGRRATTHWRHAAALAEAHPEVRVDPAVLYIDDGELLTSAGTAAGIDLCLHLVRRHHGAEAGAAVARQLVVAPHRHGGQRQYIERPLPASPDAEDAISALLAWMEQHFDRQLDVASLARRVHLSRRHFVRRFAAATGTTPHAWLQHLRLLEARRLLEHTDRSIESVATDAGFNSVETLRLHFRRATGVSPRDYRAAFGGR